MTPEQFSQILDMLSGAGEGTYALALLYILLGYFKLLLTSFIVGGIAFGVYKAVRGVASIVNFGSEVAEAFNRSGTEPSYGTSFNVDSRSDCRDMILTIQRLLAEEKK